MRVLFNADFVYVPFAGRIGTAFADDCVPFVDGCTNEVFAGCTAVEEFDCMPYFWFRYVNTNAAAIASSATHTNITVSRSFFFIISDLSCKADFFFGSFVTKLPLSTYQIGPGYEDVTFACATPLLVITVMTYELSFSDASGVVPCPITSFPS